MKGEQGIMETKNIKRHIKTSSIDQLSYEIQALTTHMQRHNYEVVSVTWKKTLFGYKAVLIFKKG